MSLKKKFCVNGHNSMIVGRYANGACRKCNELRGAVHWKNQGLKNRNGTPFIHADYDRLLEQQDERCKICCRLGSEFKRRLCADHDHRTGVVRGLLCHRCNKALGLFDDNPENLESAAQYLEKSWIS